jgi:hypothetical protein
MLSFAVFCKQAIREDMSMLMSGGLLHIDTILFVLVRVLDRDGRHHIWCSMPGRKEAPLIVQIFA